MKNVTIESILMINSKEHSANKSLESYNKKYVDYSICDIKKFFLFHISCMIKYHTI